MNLLLYSVFRIGNATNNITWQTYQDLAQRREVAWTIPLSLGDSHRGFRVLGTSPDYFEHYRFAGDRALQFAAGGPRRRPVRRGDRRRRGARARLPARAGRWSIAHGLGATSFTNHDDKPFVIRGILTNTGTPVDRTVHVSLEAIEAIHADWQSGTRHRGAGRIAAADQLRAHGPHAKAITAVLVGLKSRAASFRLQRALNEYPEEPLSAIIPGVALQQLWDLDRRRGGRPAADRRLRRAGGPARHADGDSHQPERAPPGDGHPPLRRRAAPARLRAAGQRGRAAGARGRGCSVSRSPTACSLPGHRCSRRASASSWRSRPPGERDRRIAAGIVGAALLMGLLAGLARLPQCTLADGLTIRV